MATVIAMGSQVIAYVATSLDGYIADDKGSVDFLEEFGSDEYGFDAFFEGVDALVMGSTTYDQVLGFGWPYAGTPALVLTTRHLDIPQGPKITFRAEATGKAIRAYADSFEGRVWVVGGGRVITEGLIQGAIDLLEVYVMPIALGSGIALFTSAYEGPLTLTDSQPFRNGVVKLVYSTGR